MAQIKCHIRPGPQQGVRAVFRQAEGKALYFKGNGGSDYVCGQCQFVLAKDMAIDQIQQKFRTSDGKGLVLQCLECKSFNELGADVGI